MPTLRVAALLSCETFEDFFTAQLGLEREAYLAGYRNDWVWEYSRQLRAHDVDLLVYVATRGPAAEHTTADGFGVRFVPVWGPYDTANRALEGRIRTAPLRWASEAGYAAALLPGLRAQLAADAVDVLYVQEYWTGRFDVLAHLPLPVVGADHGGRSFRQLTAFKRASLRRAAVLTAQTEGEAVDAARFGVTPVVLGNGVDTDFFTPRDPPRDPPGEPSVDPASAAGGGASRRLLHVARLVEHHKRTTAVVGALAHLPGWVLDVVGTGPDEPLVRASVERLGLGDRVVFHGFVADRERLRSLYRAASALVAPSSHEARLLVALEAMACGTPCVTSDLPVFREIVSDGVDGAISPTVEPEALAASVLRVARGGSAMREAAASSVRSAHSWERVAPSLASLLRVAAGATP